MNGASDGAIVEPYGCQLLNLCGHFGLMLTNTLNNIKTFVHLVNSKEKMFK